MQEVYRSEMDALRLYDDADIQVEIPCAPHYMVWLGPNCQTRLLGIRLVHPLLRRLFCSRGTMGHDVDT